VRERKLVRLRQVVLVEPAQLDEIVTGATLS
jgi:hypothetical protein